MTITSADFQSKIFALVACAGFGSRAGLESPKQYQKLGGQTVVMHTLKAIQKIQSLTATLVVLAPTDVMFEQLVPGFVGPKSWIAHVGGNSRTQSVMNGLIELFARGAQDHDWVLVHDAARCLIRPEWVEQLIDTCRDDEVGGLLALPLADTLKQAHIPGSGETRAVSTIDRLQKWTAQTPQMFRLGLLRLALTHAIKDQAASAFFTDEASAVEALGFQPRLVKGNFENIKITWPEDFSLAERLLRTR